MRLCSYRRSGSIVCRILGDPGLRESSWHNLQCCEKDSRTLSFRRSTLHKADADYLIGSCHIALMSEAYPMGSDVLHPEFVTNWQRIEQQFSQFGICFAGGSANGGYAPLTRTLMVILFLFTIKPST